MEWDRGGQGITEEIPELFLVEFLATQVEARNHRIHVCDLTLRPSPHTRHQKDYAGREHDSSDNRWQRYCLLGFLGCLNRTDIEHFLSRGVGDPLVGERYYPYDDQYDAEDCYRFHRSSCLNKF